MPYIPVKDHDRARRSPITSGELDYCITVTILDYLRAKKLSFNEFNTIVGVLDNVKDEFRRRILHVYEDTKRFTPEVDPYDDTVVRIWTNEIDPLP